jgi:hypothetical protein
MSRLFQIDAASFADTYGRTSTAVRHTLTDHPLLTVEAIAELADFLPADRVEHNLGTVSVVNASGVAEQVDMSPGEIARTIETNRTWMVLKNIEQHPDYKRLLDECLDEVQEMVTGREGGMHRREGFIFLSAPNSTTPAHTDPEHNILMQVRGPKLMATGDYPDPALRQKDLERSYNGGHRNMPVMPANVVEYDMLPGDGVYLPPDKPHFVKTFDEPSVSLSVTWRTPASEVVRHVHMFNARMRRLGLQPAPPGRSPGRDRAKEVLLRGMNKVSRVASRH